VAARSTEAATCDALMDVAGSGQAKNQKTLAEGSAGCRRPLFGMGSAPSRCNIRISPRDGQGFITEQGRSLQARRS